MKVEIRLARLNKGYPMNHTPCFKKTYLSSLLLVSMGGCLPALAQEAENDSRKLEVIQVSGIKSSLVRSMDLKQDAGNVVDAITAEDIGKFPDQNVAESLQRITGVTIDRSSGEGQLITVRGMGPEFNSVLLNGRTLATTSGGRAFSFDILASELINGAEVHKTQSAYLQEGSIGATVDISTMKPLENPGFQAVGSIKGMYDNLRDKTTPQFSGLISNTFDDERFGVLASFAYAKRESGYDQANTARYYKTEDEIDNQSYGEIYFPRNYDQIAYNETRERKSGSVVFQYKPVDKLTISIDSLYSKLDLEYREDVFPMWFIPENARNPVFDENNTLIKADFADSFIETLVRQSQSTDELKAFGLNIDWEVSDNLRSTFDLSKSKASSDPERGYSDVVAGRPGNFSYDRTSSDLIPTMTFQPFAENETLTAGWASLQGTEIEDEVLEARFNNSYFLEDAGPLVEIGFGALYSERTLGTTWGETEYPLPWTFADNSSRIVLPSSIFRRYEADGFLSEGSGAATEWWPTFNSDDVFDFLASEEAINQLDDPSIVRDIFERKGFDMVRDPTAYEVEEELTALYADLHFEGEIGDIFYSVITGLRYVETESRSDGQQVSLVNLLPDPNKPDQVRAIESEDYSSISETHSYDNWLPSINTKFELTEDIIVRLAYSVSVTRPELDEMSPLKTYGGGPINELTGSASNPKLEPFESKNWDYGIEWYYDEGSYAAIAGFTKDVDGYLSTIDFDESVKVPSGTYDYVISRPDNLESAEIDGVELAVQHMFTSLPSPFDGLGIIANTTFVDSETSASEGEEILPLIGLGDSSNLILFYEKNGFQSRLAYNIREHFMQDKPLSNTDPFYVDDYEQIDISASYDFNEYLTVFFEGINITNELYIKKAQYNNQILEVTENGARYAIGIRGSF